MKKTDAKRKWIGQKIRQHRLKVDLTQKKLAEMLSIKAQSISDWEKGNAYPSLSKLFSISRILNLPISIDKIELTQIEKELKESSNATTKI